MLSHQCLIIAEDLQDPGLLLEARHAAWGSYYFLGEYARAFTHMQAGLDLYDQRQHEPLSVHYGVHDARSCALYESSLALWQTGYLDQAQCRLNETVAHAQNLMLPANKADAFGYVALIYQLLREPVYVQQFAEPALHISNEKGYPFSRFMAAIALGWSMTEQGEIAEGSALAHQGMSAAEDAGQRLHYSQYAAMLAESCLVAARPVEAIDILDQAIAAFHRYRDLICAPDLWRLKGEAMLALNAADDKVESCYQDALSLAQELGAKTSELRAATGLARLRHRQGRSADGHRLLSVVYEWFSEGFDTPDLRAARQLLDMLAGLPSISS
jgi:adenylate cyclase